MGYKFDEKTGEFVLDNDYSTNSSLTCLRYTNKHLWIRVTGTEAYVGLTNHAQSKILGDIVFVDINREGDIVKQNEVFGSVESVKTTYDLKMPVMGEILEVNDVIIDRPELVNSDPYGKGWLIKIRISQLAQLNSLLDEKGYQALIG